MLVSASVDDCYFCHKSLLRAILVLLALFFYSYYPGYDHNIYLCYYTIHGDNYDRYIILIHRLKYNHNNYIVVKKMKLMIIIIIIIPIIYKYCSQNQDNHDDIYT